ncbi:MAG: signal peptidase I [Planctomycetota bacterium]
MSQTPDQPTPPGNPTGDDDRASRLIDAVVGDGEANDGGQDTPAAETTAEDSKAGGKLSRKERKAQEKRERQAERDKYDSYFAYFWGTAVKPHGSFKGYLWHKWIKPVGSVILIVAVLRSTLIDWNDVPTGSMEPTILVGDRILVNKTAYALQVPLSGPKIGVPFTPLQWDNPLDGLPSWQWGKPSRGEIVTFWNPSTGIRMVKRIVAEPGDTLEIRGGVMTLTPADGSPATATYVDTTPFPANQTIVGKDTFGNDVLRRTQDSEETILGETRSIQHIRRRWIEDWGILRLPNGEEVFAVNGVVNRSAQDRRVLNVKREQDDEGIFYRIQGDGIPIESIRAGTGEGLLHLAIQGGEPYLNGASVSYNTFAEAYLRPIAEQGPIDFNGTSIGVSGHTWLVNGEPTTSEGVATALSAAGYTPGSAQVLTDQQQSLTRRHEILRILLMSSFGPVTVAEDEYYMVGDNRNNSHDSRYFGPVARSEITGEAIAIPASFNGRILQFPPDPRWERWFHGLD